MRRASIKASRSFSQTGSKKVANIRVSNGKAAVTGKVTVKTK